MFPGDRDIGDSDLAVMSSANFDGVVFLTGDQMEPSFIPVFMFVADRFKENVRFVRLVDGHHLDIVVLVADDLREGRFADLALEFGEVVALDDTFHLFFDLAVDPGAQTSDVDQSTAAFALARRNQRILSCFFTAQANFTAVFSFFYSFFSFLDMFFDLKDAIGVFEVVGIPDGLCFVFIFGFDDHILNST